MDKIWVDRYKKIAFEVASWSKDPSTKVGAVIVDQAKRVVSFGYNGPPAGVDDEWAYQYRERKLLYTVHAEDNCIRTAEKKRLPGSILFVTHPPCEICVDKIVDAGIIKVYYGLGSDEFRRRWCSSGTLEILASKGVAIQCWDIQENQDQTGQDGDSCGCSL